MELFVRLYVHLSVHKINNYASSINHSTEKQYEKIPG
jgi:hypothetical protein